MWSSFLANINSELHVVFNRSYTYTLTPPQCQSNDIVCISQLCRHGDCATSGFNPLEDTCTCSAALAANALAAAHPRYPLLHLRRQT